MSARLLKFQPCRSRPLLATRAARAYSSSFFLATRHQAAWPLLGRCRSPFNSTRLSPLVFSSSSFSTSRTHKEETITSSNPQKQSRTLYIGNIPYEVPAIEIEQLFASFGEIEGVRMKCDEQGKHLGYAHVDFVANDDALAAYESAQEEPFWLINRTLLVDLAWTPTKVVTPSNKLFFHNFDGTTNELRGALKKYARSLLRIDFLKDKATGKPMDRGHILFRAEETATAVLNEMNGSVVEAGHKLYLAYANSVSKGRHRDERS